MLYLKVVDADGVEQVQMHENPVFVRMTKYGIYSCDEYYAQGVAAPDGSEIYQLYGKESLGLDNGYIALKITQAEYEEWIQTHDQPDPVDPEDDEPVIPSDMTADKNIPAGTYFSVGKTLYLSIRAIAEGMMIRPGENCTEMDIAAALNTLNA